MSVHHCASYSIAQGSEGVPRLELLAQLTWSYTRQFLEKQISLDGKHCLEPGCAAGTISKYLLELLGNKGRLTAFDIDPASIAIAQKNISDHRAEFKVMDLTANNPQPDEQYDLIYCGFILEHIANPKDTVKQLKGWLKPNGLLMAQDIDCNRMFSCPENPFVHQYKKLVETAIKTRGGDPRLGLRLPTIFSDAGLTDLHVEEICQASPDQTIKDFTVMTVDAFRECALNEQIFSEKAFDQFREGLVDFCNDPTAVLSVFKIVLCAGRRP